MRIGSGCWIGANAVILPGTVLGRNVVVAAGSVVRGEFPDHCVVGGVPAKMLRRYEAYDRLGPRGLPPAPEQERQSGQRIERTQQHLQRVQVRGGADHLVRHRPDQERQEHRAPRRPRALGARTASSIAAGTAHTQWCDQLIGEISRPVTAQVSAPSAVSPRLALRAATHRPAARTTTAATAHSALGSSMCVIRAIIPDSDWLSVM